MSYFCRVQRLKMAVFYLNNELQLTNIMLMPSSIFFYALLARCVGKQFTALIWTINSYINFKKLAILVCPDKQLPNRHFIKTYIICYLLR